MRIDISKAAWCAEAAAMLAEAITSGTVESLRVQLDAGATLFRVDEVGDGDVKRLLAYYILRVDHCVDGDEGVLVAAAGRADFDLTATLLPTIELQFIGCARIRVHTSRRGVAKKLAAQGYVDGEIVLRKEVNR